MPEGPRQVPKPTLDTLASQWDQIAKIRHEQISSGNDLSHSLVLKPAVLELLGDLNGKRVLDVGCGTGEFTQEVALLAQEVVGIDVSRESVRIAARIADASNVDYRATSVEAYAAEREGTQFDVVLASMTLMTVPDLPAAVAGMASVLNPRGLLVASITHPWFWPSYWGYAAEPWFNYREELPIEATFDISRESTGRKTVHFHRPLDAYVNELWRHGFVLERMLEPWPSAEAMAAYPIPWKYPRFLVFSGRLSHLRSPSSAQRR